MVIRKASGFDIYLCEMQSYGNINLTMYYVLFNLLTQGNDEPLFSPTFLALF